MNKVVNSKILNRRVVVLFNHKKDLIGYHLECFTPNVKRITYSSFSLNKQEAKDFLNI